MAPDGTIAVGGSFEGITEIGGERVETEAQTAFIASYSADGELLSGSIHAAEESLILDLGVASDGFIHALGWFRGEEVRVGEDYVQSEGDRFTPYWVTTRDRMVSLHSLYMPLTTRMAVTPEGALVFVAYGHVERYVEGEGRGETDVVLFIDDGSISEPQPRVLGSASPDSVEDVAVAGNGDIFVLMTLNSDAFDSTSSDLRAGDVRLAAREKDLVVVRCSPSGEPRSAFRVARPEDGWLGYEAALSVGASGDVVVAGRFGETVRFGDGRRTAASSGDHFVARFSAEGEHVWTRAHQANLPDSAWPPAPSIDVVRTRDRIVVTGGFMGWASERGVDHESRAPEETMFFLQSIVP